jgi:CysZ protein
MVPVLVGLVLLVGLGALGLWGAVHLAHSLVAGSLGAAALAALFALPAILAALVLALTLAQPLSGRALDGIVREQRSALGLAAPPETSGSAAALSSLVAGLASFAVGMPIVAALTVIGWVVPPAMSVTVPLKVVVTALLVAWGLVDYPLAMEGMGVRDRLRWSVRNFGAMLGFGLAATVAFAVPGLGLLVLPCAVAGAARLTRSGP